MALRSDTDGPLLTRMLPMLARSRTARLPDGTSVGDLELEWLVAHGLGPLVHRVRPSGGYRGGPQVAATLRGADLTSRALTQHLLAEVRDVLEQLRDAGLEPIVLKGVSYATRYYPEPHLRVMGDVDLLVAPEHVPVAERVLQEMGFVQPPTPWRVSHHVPPFHNAQKQIWIEVHQALRPHTSPDSADPPLSLAGLENEVLTQSLGDVPAGFLGPESELALIATGWCFDLRTRCGLAGMPRALVDAVHLIDSAEGRLDWDELAAWSRGTYTGTCVGVLLTYLDRHGAYLGPSELPARIVRSQPYVSRATLRIVHELMDRYVVGPGFGWLATAARVGHLFHALLAPRPAWRSLLATPFNVVLPAGRRQRLSALVLRGPRGAPASHRDGGRARDAELPTAAAQELQSRRLPSLSNVGIQPGGQTAAPEPD